MCMLTDTPARFDGNPTDVRDAIVRMSLIDVRVRGFAILDNGQEPRVSPENVCLTPAAVTDELRLCVFPGRGLDGSMYVELSHARIRFNISAVAIQGILMDIRFLDYNPINVHSPWTLSCAGLPDCKECARDEQLVQGIA